MTDKHLISISDFANVGPTNAAYPQTYKLKLCTYCDRTATKKALYDVDTIIVQERYCSRHARGIKK
jgi:hypothetical protein